MGQIPWQFSEHGGTDTVDVRFRRWLGGRYPNRMENYWQRCKTCGGDGMQHRRVSDVYLSNCYSVITLEAVFAVSPTLLLLPQFQQKCQYYLERYGLEKSRFSRVAIWDVIDVLLRCRVTPETTNLFRMCLLGFRGSIFKKNSSKPYRVTRFAWFETHQRAKHSAWADLFHHRQPRQIMAALEAGQWKRIARDSSPVRRKIK
jgi:hypothetical protein